MSKELKITLDFEQKIDDFLAEKYPQVDDFRLISESLDARSSNRGVRPKVHYHLEYVEKGEFFSRKEEKFFTASPLKQKPIIIGAGPAGLFCALRLLEYGIPSILLERGEPANLRMNSIAKFWRYGKFNTESNVCFGAGGAGLFSDGKLITRVKSHYIQYVMDKLVTFGAPPEIAYRSNPHLGSNKIRKLIEQITNYLEAKGCVLHYNTRAESLLTEGKKVVGVEAHDGRQFLSDHLVLATGHSAHQLYYELRNKNVQMKNKDFAVGIRIEHPRTLINKLQYGDFYERPELETARYRLSYHDQSNERGTYSFCMCPGGYVLSSGTEADGLVVNGMSNYNRHSPWSNAAFVVSIKAGVDYGEELLDGLAFQRAIEKKSYEASLQYATGREIPAQRLTDFLKDKKSTSLPKSSTPSHTFTENLNHLLPQFVSAQLRTAMIKFDQSLKGFISPDALCLAPETRTSSPVTILRDFETLESLSHQGLYPCGEGAGYAGGITSAAIDGVRVAMKILEKSHSLP
jgi:uncharacterized protein